ncbi:DUF167 domain-containing protein [Candidatus Saccharibacteria bacterium]|nr:DUF167 domain-containing protein [Candidatus Saccharibacteria bacterium]
MIITAKVKPGSKAGDKIEKLEDGTYIIYLRARAHDGEANAALIKLLADCFNVPKTTIKIKSGHTSRLKTIEL